MTWQTIAEAEHRTLARTMTTLAKNGAYDSPEYRELKGRADQLLDHLWDAHPLNPKYHPDYGTETFIPKCWECGAVVHDGWSQTHGMSFRFYCLDHKPVERS